MLRLPRTNPRPQGLHQNPSGLAVALGFTALGAVGGVGYLLYKVRASAEAHRAAYQAAMGTAYVIPTEVGILPVRLMPDGGVQLLDVEQNPNVPSKYRLVGKSTIVPNPSPKGKGFAEVLQDLATEPRGEDVAVTVIDDTTPQSTETWTTPGKLKLLIVSPSALTQAIEGLSGELKVDAKFVLDRLMNDRIVKAKSKARQKKFAEAAAAEKAKKK